jgi:hypothetical protein
MSKWPMRGHFRYLRFKTFPMTPRTPQCKVFWALLSNSKHSRVPEDSKSPTLEVLGFTPTLGQSGVATANLTPGPSFDHNSCCRCPNDSCKAILDMYTSRPFQRYKEHLKARCFDPCNRTLSFQESRRTLKSHFRECEWRPHTSLKVGLRQPRLSRSYQPPIKDDMFLSLPLIFLSLLLFL